MKDKPSSEHVARAYLAYASTCWSGDYLMTLIRREPEAAWEILCEIVDLSPDDEDLVFFVAAGPLEEFVVMHGETYLETISSHAHTSPKMRRALGGMWGETRMPKKVWRQIQKLAGMP